MGVFFVPTSPCSLRFTGLTLAVPASLLLPVLAAMTLKNIKVELKERYAVVGGTRPELLERVKQMMQGTYVFQYVPPPPEASCSRGGVHVGLKRCR